MNLVNGHNVLLQNSHYIEFGAHSSCYGTLGYIRPNEAADIYNESSLRALRRELDRYYNHGIKLSGTIKINLNKMINRRALRFTLAHEILHISPDFTSPVSLIPGVSDPVLEKSIDAEVRRVFEEEPYWEKYLDWVVSRALVHKGGKFSLDRLKPYTDPYLFENSDSSRHSKFDEFSMSEYQLDMLE